MLLIHAEILVGVCCGDKRLLLHVVGDPTDAWEAGDCDDLSDPEGGAVRADMGALLRGALSVRDDCRFVSFSWEPSHETLEDGTVDGAVHVDVFVVRAGGSG